MGEEQLPIPQPNNTTTPSYLFTVPQLPPTFPPLLHQPPLMMQQNPNQQLDIDWVSLLTGSASFMNGDQVLPQQMMPNNVSSAMSSAARNGNEGLGESFVGKPKGKGSVGSSRGKKAVTPRVAFHTRSSEDVLDDGYRWRKYGQKAVKNSNHPRSYYRCTHHTCNVKKQIQRLSKDTSIVVTTYEGIHNHPCEKLMETLGPLLKQIQFLTRF